MVNFDDNAYSFNQHFERPNCFIALEGLLKQSGENNHLSEDEVEKIIEYGFVGLNVCKRMADIDWLHSIMQENIISLEDIVIQRNKAETYLVLYFGAVKSLLDAISVGLNSIFDLQLKPKEQDFGKSTFWKKIRQSSGTSRYGVYHNFCNEIIKWRDSAVHRIHPFIIPRWYYENIQILDQITEISQIPREDINLGMAKQPDFEFLNLYDLSVQQVADLLVSPLYFPNLWREQLIKLCEEICSDIQNSLPS